MSVTMRQARTAGRQVQGLPADFADLVRMMPPRAIRDETDYDNAIEMLDRLTSLPRMTQGQQEYRETLSVLVEAYEAQHHEIDTTGITPLDVLKHLLAETGMNGSQLGMLIGNNRALGGKILRGERQLSKAHIRKLAEYFKVEPGLFL